MKSMLIITLFAFSLLLNCCSPRYHRPQVIARSIPEEYLNEQKINGPIALINSCQTNEEVDYCNWGIHHYLANYHDVTDKMITIFQDAVQRMGTEVRNDANKKIKFAVVEMNCTQGFFGYELKVILKVSLDKKSNLYVEDTHTLMAAPQMTPSLELTLQECVNKVFANKHVQAYLAKE